METKGSVVKKQQILNPRKYVVLVVNDNQTTFDFVIEVLKTYFQKSMEQATVLANEVHEKGRAIAGIYSKEVATSKIEKVREEASKKGYPLVLEMEPE